MRHMVICTEVEKAYQRIRRKAQLPADHDGLATLMLQNDLDGAMRAGSVAFWHAVWQVREARLRGNEIAGPEEIARVIATIIESPWVAACVQTSTRKERRANRIREPSPIGVGVTVYRSDGASRKGPGGRMAGDGAAFWPSGSQGKGAPSGTFREFAGSATNNIVEYKGLEASFRRAVRQPDSNVLFEVDSMLLNKQISSEFGCRSELLRPAYIACSEFAEEMAAQGKKWRIRHIYREFNQVADTLANEAIDDQEGNGAKGQW